MVNWAGDFIAVSTYVEFECLEDILKIESLARMGLEQSLHGISHLALRVASASFFLSHDAILYYALGENDDAKLRKVFLFLTLLSRFFQKRA